MQKNPQADAAQVLAALARSRTDERAWRHLYQLMWPMVFGIMVRTLGGDKELAADGAQEVFLRVAKYCPFAELLTPTALRSYIWMTTTNTARTVGRRERRLEVPFSTHDDAGGTAAPVRDPALTIALERLLESLPEEDRRIVTMLVEGASLSEVAAHLGLSYGSVAVRLHRLRKRLRERLDL